MFQKTTQIIEKQDVLLLIPNGKGREAKSKEQR